DLRLEEGKPEWGLRLRVVGGGCSGFSYELGWEDAEQDGDLINESHGVRVFVDPQSVQYVTGAEIDYVDSLYGSRFSVKNPKVKGSCGCGHSFQAYPLRRGRARPAPARAPAGREGSGGPVRAVPGGGRPGPPRGRGSRRGHRGAGLGRGFGGPSPPRLPSS